MTWISYPLTALLTPVPLVGIAASQCIYHEPDLRYSSLKVYGYIGIGRGLLTIALSISGAALRIFPTATLPALFMTIAALDILYSIRVVDVCTQRIHSP
jgi:hypothetical protein